MAEPESEGPVRRGNGAASEVLRALSVRPEPTLTLKEILGTAGSRVHGLALLFLVLPETLPLPLPSASSMLGIPILLVSVHLALFGEGRPLPPRVASVRVSQPVFYAFARYAGRLLGWLENISRHRWDALAGREHLIGAVCVYLSIILLLPIPFLNAPPAICLALLALGLIQRDGVMVAAGIGGTTAVTAAFLYALIWAKDLIFQ